MPRVMQINKGSVLVSVVNQVNSSAIRREVNGGESFIVVPSYTLPDDVVMNGGLYPADEIAKAYNTLEGTHAPIEHPMFNGEYISAMDAKALIGGYLIGAYNSNIKRDNGKVYAEKWIPERLANASDKGKRLIDRLNALMSGKGDAIHTSTGLLLEREYTDEPMTNDAGQEYTWIARNMVFDHDAILLDNPGAAQPSQGVGIFANSGVQVDRLVYVNTTGLDMAGSAKSKIRMLQQEIEPMQSKLTDAVKEYLEAKDELDDAKEDMAEITGNSDRYVYVEDWNEDTIIYWCEKGTFSIGYKMDGDKVMITSEPQPVKTKTVYERAANNMLQWLKGLFEKNDIKPPKTEGNSMKLLIAALNAAGVKTEGMADEQILAAYDEMKGGKTNAVNADQIASIVNEAVSKAVAPLQAQLQANADAEKNSLVKDLLAADVGLDEEDLKGMATNALHKLHAKHCQTTNTLSGQFAQVNSGKHEYDSIEMPE